MTALSNTPDDQLTEYAGYHFHDAVSDLVDAVANDVDCDPSEARSS